VCKYSTTGTRSPCNAALACSGFLGSGASQRSGWALVGHGVRLTRKWGVLRSSSLAAYSHTRATRSLTRRRPLRRCWKGRTARGHRSYSSRLCESLPPTAHPALVSPQISRSPQPPPLDPRPQRLPTPHSLNQPNPQKGEGEEELHFRIELLDHPASALPSLAARGSEDSVVPPKNAKAAVSFQVRFRLALLRLYCQTILKLPSWSCGAGSSTFGAGKSPCTPYW